MSMTWPVRVAAQLADISPRLLRRWIDTQVIPLRRNDKKPGGSGDPAGLSRARIIQTVITGHLTRLGISAKRAAEAGFEFTDIGESDRAPCALHNFGQSVLVVSPSSVRVANTGFDVGIAEFVPAATILDLNSIVASVDAALKEQP